ncbi:hydroxyacylglutathione hydrolase [Pseudoduganella sp. GCM10020061]|uniref:hydroxyacylglutathione hydrolase n=1 Tax=Pseudoduganella sp. GCM10020061 TaxID=3317345 RepID=UPI00363836EC
MTTIPRSEPGVLTIPAFHDNYLWLVHDGKNAVAVDPGDAAAIAAALDAHSLELTAILTTHHHADHVGGVRELARQWDVPVYAPLHDAVAGATVRLAEGDRVVLDRPAIAFRVLDVPGHTRGHIAYVRETQGAHWVFCGDTLFAGGCGRLFEGTPEMMLASLGKLASLPDDTLVYCAHEYTLANLRFALAVEPGNAALQARYVQAEAMRAAGEPTVPSTVGLERATNPFLRCDSPEIRATLVREGRIGPQAGPVQVFAALREWKNTF